MASSRFDNRIGVRKRFLCGVHKLYEHEIWPHVKGLRGAAFLGRILERLAYDAIASDKGSYWELNLGGVIVKVGRKEDLSPFCHEINLFDRFLDHIEDSKILFDIGCYHGIYSLTAAAEGLEVIAFDLSEENIRQMKRNAKLTGVSENIRAVNKAVWREETAVEATIEGTVEDRVGVGDREIEAVPLDSVAEKPDILKIDAEGAELEVLEGSENILEQWSPAIFLEIHQDSNGNSDFQRICDRLKDKGYRLCYAEEQTSRRLVYAVKD